MKLNINIALLIIIAITEKVICDNLYQILKSRSDLLKSIALTGSSKKTCSTTNFIFISEYAYGRSGNNLIEFTHGLWLSNQLNRTLAPPPWMKPILEPFNTSTLKSLFCYEFDLDLKKPGLNVLEVTSENAFFFYRVFYDPIETPHISKELPTLNSTILNGTLLKDFSRHFIKVYSALWSSPSDLIFESGQYIIQTHLNNSVSYNSVHKRSLEGGCSKIMATVTEISDYNSLEIPMYLPEWRGNLFLHHPICEMTYSFVKETFHMHNRSQNNIFIAFDGKGNIDEFKSLNTTILNAANHQNIIDKFHKETKFLEMFLCIHSEFFIMNPRSTFSFEVFVIRSIFSLTSVPILKNHDFYVKSAKTISLTNPRWVTFLSIQNSVDELLKLI